MTGVLDPTRYPRAKAEEVCNKAMEEQDGNNKFNISERLEDVRREHEALRWEGTFRDYFELVTQNPRIAQLSHARVNDMIHAAGIERLNEGTHHEIISYNFFAPELFGIEEPIARLVEYFISVPSVVMPWNTPTKVGTKMFELSAYISQRKSE